MWPQAKTTSVSRDLKEVPRGSTVDTIVVMASLLRKAVTDLCPKMTLGECMGDTFIWIRMEAACCASTERSDGFKG